MGTKSGSACLLTQLRKPDKVPNAGQSPTARRRVALASADADLSPSAAASSRHGYRLAPKGRSWQPTTLCTSTAYGRTRIAAGRHVRGTTRPFR